MAWGECGDLSGEEEASWEHLRNGFPTWPSLLYGVHRQMTWKSLAASLGPSGWRRMIQGGEVHAGLASYGHPWNRASGEEVHEDRGNAGRKVAASSLS
jgi:hypothetical protein